jgi:mono/diheme cytochrome c family protein/plastocyanin
MRVRIGEYLARFLVLAAAVLIPLAVVASRPDRQANAGTVEVRAVMPEEGGWLPDNLSVAAGDPLQLRLVSDDVVHGFAVGKMDWPAIDLPPGEVVETTLVFDKPGKYTYYCTRWCGVNHWRMRGVIEVTGPKEPEPKPSTPLFEVLGIDIDAPHPAEVLPGETPSAGRGYAYREMAPDYIKDPAYGPSEAFQELRAEPNLSQLTDQEVWDLVAALWQAQAGPLEVARGAVLYAQNCASCHGETGRGDGVMAKFFRRDVIDGLEQARLTYEHQNSGSAGMGGKHGLQPPADFTDPTQMLGASSALLQGKIIRGGMGTGMPYWGPVFTEKDTWALVAYLWSLQFEFEETAHLGENYDDKDR